MIYVTQTFHRSEPEVKWFFATDDFIQYRKEKYINTGKIKEINIMHSSDMRSKCIMTAFADETAMTEYTNDEICAENMRARREHCLLNRIITESPVITNV
jgi:hypothetical protein